MKLYITATGRYVGTQVDARADGKGWTPEEVPTDKTGLIDYLNGMVKPLIEILPEPVSTPFMEAIPHSPILNLTQSQVDEMFEAKAARPLSIDAICLAISHLKGDKLGHVALEVAARIEALTKGLSK